MNIVHLTTFYSGGAGKAAYRLHKALLQAGENSSMLFVESLNKYQGLENCYSISNQPLRKRIKNKLLFNLFNRSPGRKKINAVCSNLKIRNALLPFSFYNVLDHSVVKKADIIHLHWIDGMLDYTYFFKHCQKKLVWTLHDINPFSGLFFISDEPQLNKPEINDLDNRIKDIKKLAYNNIKVPMSLTAPSAWLCNEVKKSELLGKFDCIKIPNIVDLDIFSLRDKTLSRRELGIDESKTVFLFISMSVNDRWKGFDLLTDALRNLHTELKGNIKLIALGAADINDINDLQINFTGEIKDNELLSKYYGAADALILPSRADNLPNVMLESFACGLPVIGFPVGGIKEHVINDKTGYLAEAVTADALKKILIKFLENSKQFDPAIIRQYAEVNFNKQEIIDRFKNVYSKVSCQAYSIS